MTDQIGQYSETLKGWIERNHAVVSNVSSKLAPLSSSPITGLSFFKCL